MTEYEPDERPVEQCEWCGGRNTEWSENDEPDPHCDFPDHDIESDKVYVNLGRYCADCEQYYTVRLCFDIKDGKRMRW